MSCLIAAASIPLTSSVDIVTEGNSSGMNAVLRSHKLGGAPAEGPGRLGSRCNSSNIVKGREKGVGCSARRVSAPPARGFSSRADAHKGRGMGTVGEAGAPYPEAFNLQKKEKKSVASFFSSPQMCKNSHLPCICAMLDKARIRWAGKPGVAPSFPRDTLPQTDPISPTLYLLQDNQKTELSIISS